jgi:MFS family permease
MLPLTVGFLISGPLSGILSDRYGARPFATGGMLLAALAFGLLEVLPVNFTYIAFAALLLLMGLGMGIFSAPNQAGIMNSLPPEQRGSGAGMVTTFQNSAQVLSIGVFFTLIILGLASKLPHALYAGLVGQGVPSALAHKVAALPPVGSVFAAFLGYNPMKTLLGSALPHLAHAKYLTGRAFFPHLIAAPFQSGLGEAFTFAMAMCLIAAVASWLRGAKYVHGVAAAAPASATDVEVDAAEAGIAELGAAVAGGELGDGEIDHLAVNGNGRVTPARNADRG